MRRVSSMILLLIVFPILASCDIGLEIVSIELGSFPDNIVYYVSEADFVDFTGANILVEVREGSVNEHDIYSTRAERLLVITDNVDFSTPGVYEVTIRWTHNDDLVGRIPIQVIEREPGQGTVDGS